MLENSFLKSEDMHIMVSHRWISDHRKLLWLVIIYCIISYEESIRNIPCQFLHLMLYVFQIIITVANYTVFLVDILAMHLLNNI